MATKLGRIRLVTVFLTALLAFGGAVPAAAQVTDVPPSHWAYEAVKDLVNEGYLTVEDGLFQGNQPVDRFTLATVVARILYEIETGGVTPQNRQDVELLRRVVTEFREDLVAAYARIDRTDTQVVKSAKSLVVTDEKVSEILAEVGNLQTQANDLQRQVAGLEGRLAGNEAEQQAALAAETAQLRSGVSELGRFLDEQAQQRNQLRSEVLGLIDSLSAGTQETSRRVDALEESVHQGLAEKGVALGDLEGQLSEAATSLEADLDRLNQLLQAEGQRLTTVEETATSLKADLESLRSSVRTALAEVRSELNAQAEGLAAQQLALNRLGAVDERLDSVETKVLAMQSQIGLSEEQLNALSDRLINKIESQYQHSFLLAGTVAEELKTLKEEFQSYRQKTEQDLSSARQAQTFAIIGALLGLIGLASN